MQRLLIILPNNLGDVIMALPVLGALKRHKPGVEISFFVEEGYEAALIGSCFCDRIIKFPRKSIKTDVRTSNWTRAKTTLQSLINEIKELRFDEVVNLSQHPYVSFIVSLINAHDTKGRRFLREGTHSLPDHWSQYLYAVAYGREYNSLHATDIYCRISNVRQGYHSTTINIIPKEKNSAAQWLAEQGCTGNEKTAVFQPGAAWASKRWPYDAFIALGKLLCREGYRIVITGAPSEKQIASVITEALKDNAIMAAGRLTFRETIAVLPFMKFVVCGDTALMHAAAALGVKVYAIFGPTNPVETGPYGEGHVVLAGKCPKRPCFSLVCNNHHCMRSITPETVFGCIKGKRIADGNVDVFTTDFSGGVYNIIHCQKHRSGYFDVEGAAVTRRAFEPENAPAISDNKSEHYILSEIFAGKCREMASMLELFLKDNNRDHISAFERLRAESAASGGIVSFWSALLNIRLNGIPLLDPLSGVSSSIEQCLFTANQILRALHK